MRVVVLGLYRFAVATATAACVADRLSYLICVPFKVVENSVRHLSICKYTIHTHSTFATRSVALRTVEPIRTE